MGGPGRGWSRRSVGAVMWTGSWVGGPRRVRGRVWAVLGASGVGGSVGAIMWAGSWWVVLGTSGVWVGGKKGQSTSQGQPRLVLVPFLRPWVSGRVSGRREWESEGGGGYLRGGGGVAVSRVVRWGV